MKTLLFILTVLASGAMAGMLHGTVNLAIVEPYLDAATDIEYRNLQPDDDTVQSLDSYHSYRTWQKGGMVLAGVILGVGMASLFGIIFVLYRHVLPGTHYVKKAVILAAVMWLVLFLVPFLKYPANPPTVGDAQTIELRVMLYVLFVAISGLGAAGICLLAGRVKNKKIFILFSYAALMTAAFVIMPANPDPVTAPVHLVDGFRAASVLGTGTFWAALPLIFGWMWARLRVDAA